MDDTGTGKGADLLDIVRDAGKQLPGLDTVVVTEAQSLDLREQGIAHIVGDALRGTLGEEPLQEVE